MHKIKGVHTALVTPFNEDFTLNEEALRENIRFQLKAKIDGLVILGTTGETPTLKSDEKKRIIDITLDETKDSPIILTIGTGCYSTESTIENTLYAKTRGADAALVVTPYYNKPTQQGLYYHFKAVAEASLFPIIVYNISGRTGQNLQTETLKKLSLIENIIGVKEASGNVLQMMDVYKDIVLNRPDFCLLSGDDALTLPLYALGGCGVISVVSNLLPEAVKALSDALFIQDFEEARKIHNELLPLFKGAFIETNPIPIKAAMNHFGMQSGPCRLPLCELLPENAEHLMQLLKKYETHFVTI